MPRRSLIAVAVAAAVLILGAVAAYAYDSSNDDQIAEGVTVAGVDVGGLSANHARQRIQRRVADPMMQPLTVTHDGKNFTLTPRDTGIRADVGGMVDEALRASRDGSMLSRVARDLTGGEEDAQVKPRVRYDRDAPKRLVARVRRSVDRPAQDAKVNFPSLTPVEEKEGVKVQTAELERRVNGAILSARGDRTIEVPTEVVKPKVTRDEVEERYPAVVIINRGAFRLTLYKNLKEAATYRIAVGQAGLETPAGLYSIQNKAVNAAWHVPNKAWAGSLAGQVIPGGSPQNPLKARWMGIYDGAGIHGTDQIGSLGTAASHGCIRMAIPDVIALYNQVDVGTPVYIS